MSPASSRPLVFIDDEDDAHVLFLRACRGAGLSHPMRMFWSGEDALSYFEACAIGREPWPYVVFLDIKMPGMSGFDVLAWLHDHHLLGKMVVAMVSSSDDPADISRSFSLGAHAYLGKAPDSQKIADVVREAVKFARD